MLDRQTITTVWKNSWIIAICSLLLITLIADSKTPYQIPVNTHYLHNDAHFIASVAKNIADGHGVSYWDGTQYRPLDPDTSTGPSLFLPMAAALYAGAGKWAAYSAIPAILNILLLAVILSKANCHFSTWSFPLLVTTVVCISNNYQPWQWWIPLGEVPAALFFFLSMILISEKKWYLSGIFCGFSIFSKMMVILAIPTILIYTLLSRKDHKNILNFIFGITTTFLIFAVFLVITSNNQNIKTIAQSIISYFIYNFNFGITSSFSSEPEAQYNAIDIIKRNIIYNTTSISTTNSAIEEIITCSSLAGTALAPILFFSKRKENETILITSISSATMLAWYFLVQQHGARYFFIPGYLGILCLVFSVSHLEKKYRIATSVALGIISAYLVATGKGFSISSPINQIPHNENTVDRFISSRKITNILNDSFLAQGYPEILYYLDDPSVYLNLAGYLEKNTTLLNPELCKNHNHVPMNAIASPLNQKLMRCIYTLENSSLLFQWKTTEPGIFLQENLLQRGGRKTYDCERILFRSTNSLLQECSRKSLGQIIEDATQGRVRII